MIEKPTTLGCYVSRVRTGRNADGVGRDGGQIVHAVPLMDDEGFYAEDDHAEMVHNWLDECQTNGWDPETVEVG